MTRPVDQRMHPTKEVIKLMKKVIHASLTEIYPLSNSCFNKAHKAAVSIIEGKFFLGKIKSHCLELKAWKIISSQHFFAFTPFLPLLTSIARNFKPIKHGISFEKVSILNFFTCIQRINCNLFSGFLVRKTRCNAEVYSKPTQTFKIQRLAKILNG